MRYLGAPSMREVREGGGRATRENEFFVKIFLLALTSHVSRDARDRRVRLRHFHFLKRKYEPGYTDENRTQIAVALGSWHCIRH